MSEDYPLKPTNADLEQESVDAQEPVEVKAWQSDEVVRTIEGGGGIAWVDADHSCELMTTDGKVCGRVSPHVHPIESVKPISFASEADVAALRFKAREWEDRARDMERERDAAQARVEALEAWFKREGLLGTLAALKDAQT